MSGHYSYMYTYRLYKDKTGLRMEDFKLRSRIYGHEWKMKIWKLRCEIKNESRTNIFTRPRQG